MRLLLLASLAALAPAQEMTPRNKPAMAFDAARNRLVVFGGFYTPPPGSPRGTTLIRSDTWEWDGAKWEAVSNAGPAARAVAAAAYDSRRKKVVLFGGEDTAGVTFGDTWEWDGHEWTERKIPGPPARTVGEMVYDSDAGRMVLYGGSPGRGRPLLADTWEYDGERWREIQTPGPPARMMHTMAYHEGRHAIVLFGGSDPVRGVFAMADTWIFEGGRWREAKGPGPVGRDHHTIAYDAARRKVVLFGGGLTVERQFFSLGDTWEWDGGWTARTDLVAPPRSGRPNLAYDPNSRQLLIYGGWNDAGMVSTLWRFDGQRWRPAVRPGTP